ncbi:hypothetical protein LTSEURB_3103, partial [Salmonella enterica subsp. enterica serovar Urbana str. R8-2977]
GNDFLLCGDLLAEAMRQHIDIDKIYTIMQQHQEPV